MLPTRHGMRPSSRRSHSPAVCSCEIEPPRGSCMRVISGSRSAASLVASARETTPSDEPPRRPCASIWSQSADSASLASAGPIEMCSHGGTARMKRSTTSRRTPPLMPSAPQKRCCSRCSIASSRSRSRTLRPAPALTEGFGLASCSTKRLIAWFAAVEMLASITSSPRPVSAPDMSASSRRRLGARTLTSVADSMLSLSICTLTMLRWYSAVDSAAAAIAIAARSVLESCRLHAGLERSRCGGGTAGVGGPATGGAVSAPAIDPTSLARRFSTRGSW
mmetsp:Transcript_82364/g.246985  ORF Transcript_82364/g.246985 Transcript_82364/m.246985 type:complete len:278 (-) Transcript_82364:208-1041(-)